jgi:hypothetical protein
MALESKGHLVVGVKGRLSILKCGIQRKSLEALSVDPGSEEWGLSGPTGGSGKVCVWGG